MFGDGFWFSEGCFGPSISLHLALEPFDMRALFCSAKKKSEWSIRTWKWAEFDVCKFGTSSEFKVEERL